MPGAISLVSLLLAATLVAQEGYRTPPDIVRRCVEAAPPPGVDFSPSGRHMLLTDRESMPSIVVMARPMLRIAGSRIDPGTHGPQRGSRTTGMTLVTVADGKSVRLGVPDGADLGRVTWNADGSHFAFTNTKDHGIELWIGDAARAEVRRVPGVLLVATIGVPLRWMPDQATLLCQLRIADATPPPAPQAPIGPIVQVATGDKSPVRTFQDLLRDPHDEALFEHYMRSQLALVDPGTGAVSKLGGAAIHAGVDVSPDGRYLLVERIVRPYSYLVTAGSFPREIVVLDRQGHEVHRVADVPLADKVPIGGVRTGPRGVDWMPIEDATLTWVEALDGGDPHKEVPHRDRMMVLAAPFQGEPREWFRLRDRLGGGWRGGGVSYAERGTFALVGTYDRRKRWIQAFRVDPRSLDVSPVLFDDRSAQDAYGDPGRPLMRRNERGQPVILQHEGWVYLSGRGASSEGDRPFLDRWDPMTGQKERLFHCAEGRYETVVELLSDDATRYVVRRESRSEPPNYYLRAGQDERALTRFRDEAAELTRGIKKELLHYERDDGVKLSGTLYLPVDYQQGSRLPLLVWAYPREYTSSSDAGQVRGSPHRYTRLSGTSPLLMTLVGYAVLDDAAMPVVGPARTANDTFVDQLVRGAKAAVDKVVAMGVADPDRCAIAGHSYGAFMTANLLAHCDLFRAGIARSGAYNRTLTPFGFQNERRTFWEAPEVYFAMSPFMHAHKINEPLLLIHGEADNNSGTFPIQSRRLLHAIKGNGGFARLVMLPHESHGYRARESVLHVLAESIDWLDRHVKNAKKKQR